jgi:signal transduction histidine kinase
MSLANRISIAVVLLVAAFGTLASYALYDKVRRSLKDEMEFRQNLRLAWLESCLTYDDYHIEMDSAREPDGGAELWQVATRDGRVLWRSPELEKDKRRRLSSETRPFTLGSKDFPVLPGDKLTQFEEFNHALPMYELPTGRSRIELLITARTPSEAMYAELSRLRWALMAIVPLGTLILTIVVVWYVRRQLTPLSIVARSAAAIGPGNTSHRIDVDSKSVEIVQLKHAINGMIERMALGLERERQFSSFAAHELRTPLAQLRVNIEVALRRERSPEDYIRSLNEAMLDIDRLQKLVVDLLNLTRAQEAVVSASDHAALETVVAQAVRMSGHDAVTPEIAGDTLVQGNQELLVSAVRNVLENARRYAPGSAPELAVENAPDTVRLNISDFGPGVPEAERERIFVPLTRLDNARSLKDQNEGFGLGLAIARTAVRACGAELHCAGRADGQSGACFTFTFRRTPISAVTAPTNGKHSTVA